MITNGKWQAGKDKNSNWCVRSAKKPRNGYSDTVIAIVGSPDGGIKEAESNAHIIAAAPDLLAACEEFLDAVGSCWYECPPADKIKKAVNKAKGQ